jgi:hypothetical protein
VGEVWEFVRVIGTYNDIKEKPAEIAVLEAGMVTVATLPLAAHELLGQLAQPENAYPVIGLAYAVMTFPIR